MRGSQNFLYTATILGGAVLIAGCDEPMPVAQTNPAPLSAPMRSDATPEAENQNQDPANTDKPTAEDGAAANNAPSSPTDEHKPAGSNSSSEAESQPRESSGLGDDEPAGAQPERHEAQKPETPGGQPLAEDPGAAQTSQAPATAENDKNATSGNQVADVKPAIENPPEVEKPETRPEGDSNQRVTIDDVVSTVQAFVDQQEQERQEYQSESRRELEEMQAYLDQAAKHAERQQAQMKQVNAAKAELEKMLAQLEQTDDSQRWTELRTQLDKKWQALETAFEKLTQEPKPTAGEE